MAGTRPENPDADAKNVQFPETVPDPLSEEDAEAEFDPGTEMVPEKGDFHSGNSENRG
jgi:hypothetical protein